MSTGIKLPKKYRNKVKQIVCVLEWEENGYLDFGFDLDKKDWNQTILTAINQCSNLINQKIVIGKQNFFIFVNEKTFLIIKDLNLFNDRFVFSNHTTEEERYAGRLYNRYSVYVDCRHKTYSTRNLIIEKLNNIISNKEILVYDSISKIGGIIKII